MKKYTLLLFMSLISAKNEVVVHVPQAQAPIRHTVRYNQKNCLDQTIDYICCPVAACCIIWALVSYNNRNSSR